MRQSIRRLKFVHNLLSISHICSELPSLNYPDSPTRISPSSPTMPSSPSSPTMPNLNYPDSSYVTPPRQSNSQRKDEAAAMGAEVDEVVDDYDDAVSRPPYSDFLRELWNNRKWLRKNWKKKGKKGKNVKNAKVKKAKKAEKHTNAKKHMKGKKTKKHMNGK